MWRSSAGRASECDAAAGGASPGLGAENSAGARPRPEETTTVCDGLRKRIRRSPREYSNSSRLCSVMNCRSSSICWISGLANAPVDFEGFFRFMPVLNLDEIPRNAGQYFGTVSVHGHIVFDANSPDAFRVHAGFNGNDVTWFQALLLAPRHPGVLMDFQPKPMAGAMLKQMVKMVTRQDLPCSSIHVAAEGAIRCRGNGCRLRFQNPSVPRPDATGGPPHKDRAGDVAAIVAEYHTHVQDHQLIFPQSFGGRAGMRQGAASTEGDDGLEGRSRGALLSHPVFDFGTQFKLPNSRSQQADRFFYHLTCQNGRLSHLREFRCIFAHAEAFHHGWGRNPSQAGPGCLSSAPQLGDSKQCWIESHASGGNSLQEQSGRFDKRVLLQHDLDSGGFLPGLDCEAAVGNQSCSTRRNN